jgi:histidinol-phosphate aminotransferase
MIEKWIQADVLSQSPYQVKTTKFQIKLNQNESPWDWPTDIKRTISRRILSGGWNRYPDLIQVDLKEKIGVLNNVSKNEVIIGKGSNEILQAIFTAAIRPGDSVCTLSPTFAVYKMLAEQKGAQINVSNLSSSFTVNESDLKRKASKSKLTIICNPNSPTGTLLPVSVIENILNDTSGLVIVDEAYVDFSGVSAVGLLTSYRNLIITRTFSKAFALAGFRIGYGLMDKNLATEIQKCLLPFNIDMPSIIALETILDNHELVQNSVKQIIKEKYRLIQELNKIEGVMANDSHSNFFLVKTKLGAEETFNNLAKKGILIRDVSSYPGLESYSRITVGTSDENNALIRAFREIM